MGDLSEFAAAGLQNLTLRGESFSSPTDVYLGWFTSPPMADGTADQVTGGGHTRQAISFAAASGGTITSDAPVSWSTFHADVDQYVVGWGIWDAATAGNLLAFGRTPTYRVDAGRPFTATTGAITVTSNDQAMSDVLANAWLDHLFRNDAYTPPTETWLGQYTTTPTATDAGVEVSDTDYARQLVDWAASTTGSSVLDSAAVWAPLATEADQILTGWALLDDETTGDVLWFYSWPTPVDYTAGDTILMNIGSVTLKAA